MFLPVKEQKLLFIFILIFLDGFILIRGQIFHACSYPALRVAYIDEVEEREDGRVQKVYYSVLVKALDNHDQVISF